MAARRLIAGKRIASNRELKLIMELKCKDESKQKVKPGLGAVGVIEPARQKSEYNQQTT